MRKLSDGKSTTLTPSAGREANVLPGPSTSELLRHRIAPLRRHARTAQVPGNRPRHDRSEHGLPRRPDRPDRRARHCPPSERRPAASEGDQTSRHERPDDRQPEALRLPEGETGMAPTSFITLDGLRRRGWSQIPSGWLVESNQPLTSEQIANARDLAAGGGLIDRDPAGEPLLHDAHRHRNRRRRSPRARDPRHDRRADPQRERR